MTSKASEIMHEAYNKAVSAVDHVWNMPYNHTLKREMPLIQQLIDESASREEKYKNETNYSMVKSEGLARQQTEMNKDRNELASFKLKEFITDLSKTKNVIMNSKVKNLGDGLHFVYGGNAGIITKDSIFYNEGFCLRPEDVTKENARFVAYSGDVLKAAAGGSWQMKEPTYVLTHSHWFDVMQKVGKELDKEKN